MGKRTTDWNEIQFVSWAEFKQMAPSILQLEVKRLGGIIGESHEDTDFHNSMVRARFALQRFIACIKNAQKAPVEEVCVEHLREAIMNSSVRPESLEERTHATLDYVVARLNYVHDRIRLIY